MALIVSKSEDNASEYEKIEKYRENNDFIIRILYDPHFARSYVMDIAKMIRDNFEIKDEDRKKRGETRQGEIREDILKEFESVAENMLEDPCAGHALFFFGLYTCPSFSSWVMEGNEKAPPPPLTDRLAFGKLLLNEISGKCEEVLSGKHALKIDEFSRWLRAEYLMTCGVPLPPHINQGSKNIPDCSVRNIS
jgi:hypothetical protein